MTLSALVTRPGESGETARAISHALDRGDEIETSRSIRVGETEFRSGSVYSMPAAKARLGNLWGVNHTDLAIAAEHLTWGRLNFDCVSEVIPSGMTTWGEIFGVGSTHHLIGHLHGGDSIGAIEFFPVQGEVDAIGTDRSLWPPIAKRSVASSHRRHTKVFRSPVESARNCGDAGASCFMPRTCVGRRRLYSFNSLEVISIQLKSALKSPMFQCFMAFFVSFFYQLPCRIVFNNPPALE